MIWVLGILAALCVLYYIIIVLYSGITTSFSLIWLIFGAFFMLTAAFAQYYKKHKEQVPLWVPVAFLTFCGTGIFIFCLVEILVFTSAAGNSGPGLDYVIVLGAGVKDRGLSNSLKLRLDKAMEYLEKSQDTVLVLSGGQGEDEPISEALAMRDYLLFNGVKGEQMLVETRSHSTVENIAYSRLVIEADQEKRKKENRENGVKVDIEAPVIPEKPVEIGVITNSFHVFRAKEIGQKWGIPQIRGIAAPSDPVLFVHLCVRECVAILKDKLMGNM